MCKFNNPSLPLHTAHSTPSTAHQAQHSQRTCVCIVQGGPADGVLTTLTTVGLAANAVDCDGNGLVRLQQQQQQWKQHACKKHCIALDGCKKIMSARPQGKSVGVGAFANKSGVRGCCNATCAGSREGASQGLGHTHTHLPADGAQGHASRAEPLHDVCSILHLVHRDGCLACCGGE